MTEIVIAEAVRSAVGRAIKGSLASRRPDEMAGDVIRELLARVPSVTPDLVDDVVLGCAMPEGEQGMNVARLAGLLAGLPEEASAMTVNRLCSSDLQAIALAAGQIAAGYQDIVVAGGVESMSMVPMTGNKLSASPELMASNPAAFTPMGITAENVATKFNVSREEQDAFAYESQMKAKAALEANRFQDEIVPIRALKFGPEGRQEYAFSKDELPRPETTLEGLAKLRASFAKKGSVTPGNASPLSDGAAASLVMTRERADALGIKPLATFRSFARRGSTRRSWALVLRRR